MNCEKPCPMLHIMPISKVSITAEGMVRRLIERITVYSDRLAFEFKCGLETEVQM